MNKEEKKAIELIGNFLQDKNILQMKVDEKTLRILFNYIIKQEKVIDEMAEHLKFLSGGLEIVRDGLNIEDYSKEEIKQYFYRKVENNVKN